MTKAPFMGHCERGKDLLDIIHSDVCGPFRTSTRRGERYFVTFTDDLSRFGYVYLIKHKSETFEVFRAFQHEVENQLGKKFKILRSNRGGEYLSQEFNDYLRECDESSNSSNMFLGLCLRNSCTHTRGRETAWDGWREDDEGRQREQRGCEGEQPRVSEMGIEDERDVDEEKKDELKLSPGAAAAAAALAAAGSNHRRCRLFIVGNEGCRNREAGIAENRKNEIVGLVYGRREVKNGISSSCRFVVAVGGFLGIGIFAGCRRLLRWPRWWLRC